MTARPDPAHRVARVAGPALYELRYEVLRRGTASDDVEFAADGDPTTVHLAVLGEGDEILAASTWIEHESADRPGQRALQVRGMAVAGSRRRQGLGTVLIDAGIAMARDRGIRVVWANARDSALDFYLAQGFVVVGEGFVTTDTRLPHHRIVRDL